METVMDQPSSFATLSLHPEADVRKQRANSDVVRTHLYNHGLRLPGVEIAYAAAYLVSRDPAAAWEAARRHQLQLLGFAEDLRPTARDMRSDPSGAASIELDQRRAARQLYIDEVRALPNPYAIRQLLTADEIQRGNADLERAA